MLTQPTRSLGKGSHKKKKKKEASRVFSVFVAHCDEDKLVSWYRDIFIARACVGGHDVYP